MNKKEKFKKGSFVVLSDFHSFSWPVDKIEKYYLDEYEHIYILGDATDRGKNLDGKDGIRLLRRIKGLSDKYPERVHYIPGNHDQMLFGYMDTIDTTKAYADSIENNGGDKTLEDVDLLHHTNKKESDLLKNWLGSQPIQRKHFYKGKTYCLAHAYFDDKVYKKYPNLNLRDVESLTDEKSLNIASNILWYRKGRSVEDDELAASHLPDASSIIVIGHTPIQLRQNQNLDLRGTDGKVRKVVCVDGGIAYSMKFDKAFKYDGNSSEPIQTCSISHFCTSDCDDSNDGYEEDEEFDDEGYASEDFDDEDFDDEEFDDEEFDDEEFDDEESKKTSKSSKIKILINSLKKLNISSLLDILYDLVDRGLDKTLDIYDALAEKLSKIKGKTRKKAFLITLIVSVVVSGSTLTITKLLSSDSNKTITLNTNEDESDDGKTFYEVIEGDTLSEIATRFNTTEDVILYYNPNIVNADMIYVGEEIMIYDGVQEIPTEKTYTKQG